VIRFIQKIFSEKFVVSANLFLFVLCILVGVVAYGGKLHGGGDDMNNLAATVGNGSSLEYIKWYYLNWGQTGIVALIVPIQAAIKLFHLTPDGFPWWFFASINAFCYLAAGYMLVMGGRRLLKYEWHESLFLLSFIYGVWLTPIVYNSTIDIPVTFFVAFTLPVYILAVAIYLFSADSFGKSRKDWLVIGVIYTLLSTNTETFLLSIPVVFTGMILIRAFQEKHGLIKIFGNIGFFAALSVLSIIFIWTQPGFHARPLSLDFHVPSFLETFQWYTRVLEEFGFSILLENHYQLTQLVRYLIPFLLAVIVFGLWLWRKRDIQMNSHPQIILLLSKAIWALILILGFLFCMVPLLFTGYYPSYVIAYPIMLMAGCLGLVLSFFIHLFQPDTISEILVLFGKPAVEKNLVSPVKFFPIFSVKVTARSFFSEGFPNSKADSISHSEDRSFVVGEKNFSVKPYYFYWNWLRWAAVVLIFGFIFYSNTILHFTGIYKAYQVELASSAMRQDFHKAIETAYYKTGQKNFIVTGCPQEIIVEQFWGISGYFYWKGINDVFGVLDTDPALGGLSPQEMWPDKKNWYEIKCLKLTSDQLYYLEP
jgi:hypothetical protein